MMGPSKRKDASIKQAPFAAASLPERQREALLLCHFQELSNIEAAQVLSLTVDALESLLARARRGLRVALLNASGAESSTGTRL